MIRKDYQYPRFRNLLMVIGAVVLSISFDYMWLLLFAWMFR